MTRSSFCWFFVVAVAWPAVALAAQVPGKTPAPPSFAILLGVQEHQEERLNLAYTLNDAAALGKVLRERAGIPDDHILELTDNAPPERKPTLANVRRAIPPFLAKLKKGDRLLVFFAGHGFVQADKTFLVLHDSSTTKLADTALPTSELRQWLDRCPAQEKVLLLDCCHAGGARSVPPGKSAEEVARPLEDSSVVVLAGCGRKEQSWEWHEQRQGVFSYWLCKGLAGGADENNDGQLSVDEVYSYVEKRVSTTAAAVLHRQQKPRMIRPSEVERVPTLLTLQPEEPESLCRRLAAELDLHLRRLQRKKAIVMPDLLVPLGQKEGGSRASLPAYLAARIQQGLAAASRPDPKEPAAYQVLTQEQARAAARGFRFDDLGRKEELARLSQNAGQLDVILSGTLRERGRYLHLQYEVIDSASGDVLDRASGVLPVSATLLGMNGDSFDIVAKNKPNERDEEVLTAITDSRQHGHPLLKATFPFHVEVVVVQAQPGEKITDQTPRQVRNPVVKQIDGKNTLVVPFKKGEIYELRIHNHYNDRVGVTVLVDGINALGQKRERIGKAWSWVLNAKDKMTVEGWSIPENDASQPGKIVDFRVKRFEIVDVLDSVAGRQGFSDELGTLTVAFFAEGARGKLATGEGPEEERQFRTTNFRLGALLSVVHLHYIDADELKR